MKLKLFAFALLLAFPLAAKDPVVVRLAWQYHDFPARVRSFEPISPRKARLWKTGSVKKAADLPVGDELSELRLREGERKKFVLVIENGTKAPLYFFAAPHQATPPEFALGFKFKCLCINHSFQIPPGEIWYRVVELRMSRNFLGKELEIKHAIVGIDEERMKQFELRTGED